MKKNLPTFIIITISLYLGGFLFQQYQHLKIESVLYTDTLNESLYQINQKLTPFKRTADICSDKNRQYMENIIYQLMLIQTISYKNNSVVECTDRANNLSLPINPKLTPYFSQDHQEHTLFRYKDPQTNENSIYFSRSMKEGWINTHLDPKGIHYWLKSQRRQYDYNVQLFNQYNDILMQYPNQIEPNMALSVTQYSYQFPFHFRLSYSYANLMDQIQRTTYFWLSGTILFSLLFTFLLSTFKSKRKSVHNVLLSALKNHEIIGLYQPIIDLSIHRYRGAEMHIYWQHPKDGLLSFQHFFNAVQPLPHHIMTLEQLIYQIAQDLQSFIIRKPNFFVSINIHVKWLFDPQFIERIISIMSQQPILQQRLMFELNEQQQELEQDLDQLALIMDDLRQYGIRWALSDFGSGHISFATLETLHFEMIKIDQRFVASAISKGVTQSIFGKIIEVIQELDCDLVAKGVTSQQETKHLLNQTVLLAQGTYFSTILTPLELKDLLNQQSIPINHQTES